MKQFSIIIITYNRPDDLFMLVRNLVTQQNAAELLEEVIVVNNASTVDYSEVVAFMQDFPYFRYHYSNENLGVAKGRNLAISLAKAPLLITIDDDAVFRDNDALLQIQHFFAKPSQVGILCFKVLYSSTGQVQKNAFPHKHFDEYKDKASFLAPYFIGCGHAILREVYEIAGVYPEDFFYGMEEYDLTYRVLNSGFQIAYAADVVVLHHESPLGRPPHSTKLQMLWVNKSKVAYRYLPFHYFVSTALLWSIEFLVKTKFEWKVWFAGWKKILNIPRKEKRHPVNNAAWKYLKNVKARLWY